ncbi:hypothetical protein FHW96_000259 [Novosphingobium sp. SG751A]|nr:hypothetical protein [Novosphingobium sp. SG751A]NOW44132.1 hypothetical protein [Novosphingobium sp. SG751A]
MRDDLRAAYALFMSQTPAEMVAGLLIVGVLFGTIAGLWLVTPN